MDKIEFRRTKIRYGADAEKSVAINIFVNGRNLLDDIHKYEENRHIGGGHVPITNYELYESLAEDYLKKDVPIYGCGCGVIECCPVYISVKVNERTVTWYNFDFAGATVKEGRKFRALTFDKEQYFAEIDKFKHLIFDSSAIIEYGGINCGGINLKIKKDKQIFDFWFDDLLGDPIPDIVRLLNFVKSGENLSESTDIGTFYHPLVLEFGENDLEFQIEPEKRDLEFQISAWHSTAHKIWLDFKIYYKAIYGKEITFKCIYICDELEEMLKKFLSDLLNDEKFPYIYPLYDRYDDISLGKAIELAEETAKQIPKLTYEELENKENELLLQMMKDGKIELCNAYKIFSEKYKKMLTDYVIPENWFKE